jgi:diacylglycerol kinase family enzyme
MQIAVVVNPTSGKRRGEQIAHEAVHTLRGFGHQVDEIRGENGQDAHAQLPLTAEIVPRALTMIAGTR